MPPRSRTPYRDRITEYCARFGIDVPESFDAPKSSDRFAFVERTGPRAQLLPRSVSFTRDAVSILRRAASSGQNLMGLDFKRLCEVHLSEDGRLECGDPIDALSAEERRRHDWLKS